MEVYKITKNLKVILSQFTLRKLVLFDCFIFETFKTPVVVL